MMEAEAAEEPPGPCPRCGGGLRRQDDGYWCDVHGPVPALLGLTEPTVHHVLVNLTETTLPFWLPWPLPADWAVAGVARAAATRTQATVVALTGPDLVSGQGDLVVVCEEPGVGLGARYAGVQAADPGREIAGRPASVKVLADGHATPLWWMAERSDRDVFVGEAQGRWLWLVAWPATSGALVRGGLRLTDLHDLVGQLDLLPLTELSERLSIP